jgi:DHA2 family multidrug resistance protein
MSASTPASSAPESAADRPTLESKHTGLLMVAVMGVSIIQFLDLTIANVALPHMQTSLGASFETISWVMTSFIIAGVLVLPLTGWLSDRIGSRNLFIGATAMFVLSSMLCGTATSLTEMVLFRSLQGIAAGAGDEHLGDGGDDWPDKRAFPRRFSDGNI